VEVLGNNMSQVMYLYLKEDTLTKLGIQLSLS